MVRSFHPTVPLRHEASRIALPTRLGAYGPNPTTSGPTNEKSAGEKPAGALRETSNEARLGNCRAQVPFTHAAVRFMHGSAKQRTPGPEQVGSASWLPRARQSQPVQ